MGNDTSRELGALVRRPLKRLRMISWRDLLTVLIPVLLLTLALGWVAVKLIRPAPPDRVVILSGHEDGAFYNTAKRYAEILARHGVRAEVVVTDGSAENLQRLLDPTATVDVGLVQTGLVDEEDAPGLISLGTIEVQPMLVFYRGRKTLERLTDMHGLRVAIGPDGSGTQIIANRMFSENGMEASDLKLFEFDGEEAIDALVDRKVDVIFITGEQVRRKRLRELMREPGIRLMSFRQADGYLRRLRFLSRLSAPEGSFDLGMNLPRQNTELVGTAVELIARDGLHPAISDLLIAAAREVHGKPGTFRKANEFPQAVEHEIPIGEEAQRYYTSGAPFLYKRLPFWLASLIDRVMMVLVPTLIVLLPMSRLVAPMYRWRMRSRIYRWYGALMMIERDMRDARDALTPEMAVDIQERLNEIDTAVNTLQLPLAFADQLYVLREHIAMVRARFSALEKQQAA